MAAASVLRALTARKPGISPGAIVLPNAALVSATCGSARTGRNNAHKPLADPSLSQAPAHQDGVAEGDVPGVAAHVKVFVTVQARLCAVASP